MAHTAKASYTLEPVNDIQYDDDVITNDIEVYDVEVYDVITNDPPIETITSDKKCKDVSVSIGYWTNRGKFVFY